MRRKFAVFCAVLFFCTSVLSGCNTNKTTTKSGFYFDTIIQITLYHSFSTEKAEEYIEECFSLAKKYEALFSSHVEESDISKINERAGEFVEVSEETIALLEEGIAFGELSNGLFDITIGALTKEWNISEQSKQDPKTHRCPTDAAIGALVSTISYQNIEIDGNRVRLTNEYSQIDLGGIAKGYIADKMKEYLLSEGVTVGFINLGGNLLTLGQKADNTPYTIGIQKPFADSGECIGKVKVSNASVVTSGIYERYITVDGIRFHHLLDPRTGFPIENNLYGITIIAPTSVEADALSTTCFALGLRDGLALIESLPGVEAIFITNEYEIITSSGIGTSIPFERID